MYVSTFHPNNINFILNFINFFQWYIDVTPISGYAEIWTFTGENWNKLNQSLGISKKSKREQSLSDITRETINNILDSLRPRHLKPAIVISFFFIIILSFYILH